MKAQDINTTEIFDVINNGDMVKLTGNKGRSFTAPMAAYQREFEAGGCFVELDTEPVTVSDDDYTYISDSITGRLSVVNTWDVEDRVLDYNENLIEGEEPITFEEMLDILSE